MWIRTTDDGDPAVFVLQEADPLFRAESLPEHCRTICTYRYNDLSATMPALRLLGREWRTSTDVLAVPCMFGAGIAACYIIVFSIYARHFHLWDECGRNGKQYIATSTGLLAVFGASLLNQVSITCVSLRGKSASDHLSCSE